MPFDPHDRPYLLQHFENHWDEFGAANPESYEAMAVAFMTRPLAPPIFQCVRANGMICRYDSFSEESAVLYPWGYLATYFKPDPAIHGYPTNLQYFRATCQ